MKASINSTKKTVTATETVKGEMYEPSTWRVVLNRLSGESATVPMYAQFGTEIPVPPVDPGKPPDPIDPGVGTEWVAERPRQTVSTVYVPSTGVSRNASTADQLRAAIAASAPEGDEIVVTAPVVGNFTVVGKKITIRGANLPPAGKRVTASTTGLPSVRTSTPWPVFTALQGARVWLAGLDIGAAPELTTCYSLVEFGSGTEASTNEYAGVCVVDRCLVRGHDNLDVRRGVRMESAGAAVVDSSILGIHTVYDGCAVFASAGPGPYGVYNTLLEASGENFMFGGADAKITGVLPSDITLDRVYARKLAAWETQKWQLKNLGEAKVGRRMLIRRSVFERNRVSTQPGYALVLSATDQDRTAPWSTIEDVTMEWCEYKDVIGLANLTGWVYDINRFWTRRVSIKDTLVGPLSPGLGICVQLQRHLSQAEIARCTFERFDYGFSFEGQSNLDGGIKGVRITDNLLRGWTPFYCPAKASQTGLEPEFDAYAPGRLISGNQVVGYNDPLPATSTKGVNRVALAEALAGVVQP